MDKRLENAETIVFDVGNVLLSFEPEKVIGLLPKDIQSPMFRAMFDERRLWGKFDLGAESNESISREIAAYAGMPEKWEWPMYLLSHFHETMRPLPMYHMLPILRGMGKRLLALTNYPEPSYTLVSQAFPELQQMDGVLVSAREKLAKPDPAIYRLLARRFSLNPAETLYIDDAEQNAAAAKSVGFRAWHYAENDRL